MSDGEESNDAFNHLYNEIEASFVDEIQSSFIDESPNSQVYSSLWDDVLVNASSSNAPRKKRNYINRDLEEGDIRLYKAYFAENATYKDYFRRRYRMRKILFMHIKNALESRYQFFQESKDATGKKPISTLQKCTAAMRMLAYRGAADEVDEYCRMGESTALECLKRFTKGVIEIFGAEYLRKPNETDIQRLLHVGANRGFPGMLGSIDCMHWRWKNCPTAWQRMFTNGHKGKPTIILEAVADKDLWIWHAYFGVAGANNDINVLDRSSLFDEFLEGRGTNVQFSVNGTPYDVGYYLADGIYPEWPTFVKSFPRSESLSDKRRYFAQQQESARKDVERAFGVLQSRFAIVVNPARLHKRSELGNIMKACIILHNMIIDDERDTYGATGDYCYDSNNSRGTIRPVQVYRDTIPTHYANREEYYENHRRIRNRSKHHQLQNDLMEHLWNRHQSRGA